MWELRRKLHSLTSFPFLYRFFHTDSSLSTLGLFSLSSCSIHPGTVLLLFYL